MDTNETNNTNQMNNDNLQNGMKKGNGSKAINIIIIVLALALIAVIAFSKRDKNPDTNVNTNDNASSTTSTTGSSTIGGGTEVPAPTGVWTSGSFGTNITFDVPPNYYISHPVIGSCKDVTSISTQTAGDPTVPVALIYKAGCVTDDAVTTKYTHQTIKNGYVFQTSATSASVVSIYNQIVASAK